MIHSTAVGGQASINTGWDRPPVATKVSGAKLSDQRAFIASGFSIVDIPQLFPCLQAFYAVHIDAAHTIAAENIIDVVTSGPQFESKELIAGHAKGEGEVSLHSRFFTAFVQWWSKLESTVLWFHEHRLYTESQVDMMGFIDVRKPERYMQPTVLVEFVLESTTPFAKKVAQLQAEARNACHVGHKSHPALFLGVLIDPSTIKFELHAFTSADRQSLADVVVVSGGKGDLSRLLALLQTWCSAAHILPAGATALSIPDKPSYKNVRINQGQQLVLKEYDYRSDVITRSKVDPVDRRRALPQSLIAAGVLPNAKLVVSAESVSILQYTHTTGSHTACSAAQFLQVAKQLRRLHELGYVHGDVREANIVFSAGTDAAQLIDFDMCRLADKECELYASNFNVDIDDGARHIEAKPGLRLFPTHDWFGLRAIMKLYTSVQVNDWKALITSIDSEREPVVSFPCSRSEPRSVYQDDTGSPGRTLDSSATSLRGNMAAMAVSEEVSSEQKQR
jgi:hypothetical protein